jgi:hypothetical protein
MKLQNLENCKSPPRKPQKQKKGKTTQKKRSLMGHPTAHESAILQALGFPSAFSRIVAHGVSTPFPN